MPSDTSAKRLELFRRTAGTGDTRFRIDDDIVGVDHAGFHQRDQRQLRAGRIAARHRDQPRIGDRRARDFGQAIDGFALQPDGAVRMAVPFRIDFRIGEPKIGREIEHTEMRRECRDHLLRRAMRQAAEDEIELAPIDIRDGDEIGEDMAREMRENRADPLAGLAIRGQRADRRIRVVRQDAQQLGAGVTGRAQDADPHLVRARSHEPLLSSTNTSPEKERASRRTPLIENTPMPA